MRRAAPLAWLLLFASAVNAQKIEGPSEVAAGKPAWFGLVTPTGASGAFFPTTYLWTNPEHVRDGSALFWALSPGEYLITGVVIDWEARRVRPLSKTVVVKGDPQPDPQPDPEPGPAPARELWAVVVEESSQRTPAQARVILSARVRGSFKAGRFKVADRDVLDRGGQMPSDMVFYIGHAAGKPLPRLYLVDEKEHCWFQGDMPETVDAMVALVSKYLPRSTSTQRSPQSCTEGVCPYE